MATTEIPRSVELRERLLEQSARNSELRALPAERRGDTYLRDLKEANLTIESLDAELRAAEGHERALREWADAVVQAETLRALAEKAERDASRGPTAATVTINGTEYRTLGGHVEASEAYAEWRDGNNKDWKRFPDIEVELRALLDSSDGASGLVPAGTPIPPIPAQRRTFIRDLLASGQTTLGSIPYVRELNAATNETGASSVPEGGLKPELTMEFVAVDAPVRKIAGWIPATEEILADAPTLRSYIDARLAYMVAIREENDLIRGNPAVTVEGVTVVTGHQTQSALQTSSTNDPFKTLAAAFGKVENVDGEATGVAMNPVDYWSAIGTRWGTNGSFDGGSPFNGPPGTIWGVPAVRTRALNTSEAIVADWARGGQVFDRSGLVIKTSDSHDDWFVYNKVAILAEKRIAFAIYRPDYFVVCDLTA